jgi:carboxypeptidase C (cathepsin A)
VDENLNDSLRFNPNAKDHLQKILEDRELEVLVLAGDLDYKVNFIGVDSAIRNLDWYGKEGFDAFNGGRPKLWHYFNETLALREPSKHQEELTGGEYFKFEKLTFMRVFNAGLRIFNEKPDLMWTLLQRWLVSHDIEPSQ